MYTKKFRAWLVSALATIMFFCTVLACFVGKIFNVSANTASTTQAHLLSIDDKTKGEWYDSTDDGWGDDPENRFYGKEGLVYFLQKASYIRDVDGKPFTDLDQFNDMTENSPVHLVEKPSYVDELTSHFVSITDRPHGYWINKVPMEEALTKQPKMLLPYEEDCLYGIRNNIWTQDYHQFSVKMNDDEWHKVSFYLGSYWDSSINGPEKISIVDEQGNTVCYTEVEDINRCVWVSFAIKGSFSFYLQQGGSACAFNMVAFDKLEQNPDIGISDFTGVREGVQTINLLWTNKSEASVTNIYRRKKGEQFFDLHAVAEEGVSAYTDNDTEVATEYEYMLASGTMFRAPDGGYDGNAKSTPTIYLGGLPDESNIVSVATAPYSITKIEFEQASYAFGCVEDWTIKGTVFVQDDNKEFQPYPGVQVKFALDGDWVYTYTNAVYYPNMNTDLGTITTDANGQFTLVYSQEYAGEYSIRASVDPVPDAYDIEKGTAASSAEVSISKADAATAQKPYLMNISDDIKPGDTVSISGNAINLSSNFTVAYAPNVGVTPTTFDENDAPNGVEYMTAEDLLVVDENYDSGIMFTFPADKPAGSYDFWIRNENGWSNGITLNAARPLYINQDLAYEGIPVEIAGRNFLVSNFGVCSEEEALNKVKVKLSPVNGGTEYIVPVLTGVRCSAEDSATGDVIVDSHSYRLTFATPKVTAYGEYKVYVAADGEDFRLLNSAQTLTIVQKKNNEWDTDIFGSMTSNTHIGNDPLDLKVGWAQDLNYTNIKTMTPNQEPGAEWENLAQVTTLTNAIQNAINALSSEGGGIVYFPEGTYYIGTIWMKENVFLLGAGADKTKLLCVNTYESGNMGALVRTVDKASNIGVARIGFGVYEHSTHNPDFVIMFMESDGGASGNNITIRDSKNKFVTDCSFDFRWETTFIEDGKGVNSRALIGMNAYKNILYQNNTYVGGASGLYSNYHNDYAIIRNSRVHMDGVAQTFSSSGNYTFIENVYLKSNYKGHGFALRNNAYISDCFVTRTGDDKNTANNGEMIMFEPPGGYFSTGYVLAADARSFTIAARDNATFIRETSRVYYNNFAIYISEGKGAGQIRYFKFTPTNSYGNQYEFLDNEEDWDIIPDSTSVFSILCPMEGATVYNIHGTDCKKAIFLYSDMFDAVVANCNLWETEGISVFAGDVNDQRFLPARGIRIENNRIDGISRLTGKGGINVMSQRGAGRVSNGAQLMNIVIRNNVVTNVRVKDGTSLYGTDENGVKYYIGTSETPDTHGIAIWTGATEGLDTTGDARFIIIEGNSVDNCEYGVYCDNRITGIVIRNNDIGKTDVGKDVTFFTPNGLHIFANHTLYVDGQVSELSGEYGYGKELPTLADKDGKAFYGWSLTETYDPATGVVVKGLDSNAVLYAVYGRRVTFDLGYTKKDGTSTFNTINVMDGETVEDEMIMYGDPFRMGYEFGGWYLDEACTQAFDASQAINSNLTVYAKWIGDEEDSDSGNTGENGGCAGCNGSIGGASAFVGILGLAGMAILRKKRK